MANLLKASEAAAKNLTRFADEGFGEFPDAAAKLLREEAEQAEEMDRGALREQVLAEAREEAERKIQEAYAKGLEKGQQAGEAQFKESIAQSAEALESAAAAMREARKAFLESLEPQVVELAALIAQRVLDRELRTDPELIHATARRALSGLADRQKLHIRVHPDDLEALDTHKVSLLHDFSGIDELEVEADGEVSPGGCLVDTETLHVDATMEMLLATVLEALSD